MDIEFSLKKLSPNSRFSIHDVPPLPPGICFICGAGSVDDRKFLDFGKQVKWYGAVYFCSMCIREISEAFGFHPSAVLELLVDSNAEFTKTNAKLKEELSATRESHRTMAATLSRCNCSLDGPHSDDDEADEADSESAADDSKAVKPNSVKGSRSVRSTGNDTKS